MKNLLWDMFVHTGKIEYYVKYKELMRSKDGKNINDRKNL